MNLKLVREESGQVLVITVLSLSLLLGFMALAVDMGVVFNAKRQAQIAADAAAIAGALEFEYNGTTNVVSKGKAAALANGVANSYVNVTTSPSGVYHKTLGYVQATVNMPASTYFLGAFNGMKSMNVGATAVAGITPSPACIYVLDTSAANALNMKGNSSITAPNCGIVVDSNNASALCVTGGSNTVVASYIWVTGSQGSSGHCSKTPDGGTPIDEGIAPQNDPFGGLTGPKLSDCKAGNTVSLSTVTASTPIPSTTVTDAAGKTAQLTCFSASNVSIASGVTLGSDPSNNGQIFLFENGVSLSGTVTVNGTMDIYQGTFKQNNAVLNVYAPGYDDNSNSKTLTYNGIGIMQPSSNTTGTCQTGQTSTPCLQVQFGSSNGNLNGLIYAPTSQVFMQDNGGGTVVTGIIADTLYNKTSTLKITDSYNSSHPSTTPLSTVQLVE